MPKQFECHHCGFKLPTRWGWGYGYCSRLCYLYDYIPESFEKDLGDE